MAFLVSQTRKIDHQDEEDVAQAVRFSTWDSNIQLSMAFLVNALLLIMGVAVLKTGSVRDHSFFGLYEALSDPSAMSNGILLAVAKSGILATLFAVALLASGQNSTITGTLTGQVIMEGCFWPELYYYWYVDRSSHHGRLHPYAYPDLAKKTSHTIAFCDSCIDLCFVYKYKRNDRRTYRFE